MRKSAATNPSSEEDPAPARTSAISVLTRGKTTGSSAVKAGRCILVRVFHTAHTHVQASLWAKAMLLMMLLMLVM